MKKRITKYLGESHIVVQADEGGLLTFWPRVMSGFRGGKGMRVRGGGQVTHSRKER